MTGPIPDHDALQNEILMLNDDFMRSAGFDVPSDFDPWTWVSPVDASTVDGTDLILRLGDLPAEAAWSECLLREWAERARYALRDLNAKQAVDILFVSIVTSAVIDEGTADGYSGPVATNVDKLLRDGAPKRFVDHCVRIDGEFLMAMLADQFDKSVASGGPLRSAVRRRRIEGSRRS